MDAQILSYELMDSPVGPLLLAGQRESVAVIGFLEEGEGDDAARLRDHLPRALRGAACVPEPVHGGRARYQLEEYFAGGRREFELELELHGTPFQQRVWRQLLAIPYGHTWSYGRLAGAVGGTHPRAVGMANHANPIAIIVPCHRVIGHDGALVGFGGGLPRKRWLLEHESPQSPLPLG